MYKTLFFFFFETYSCKLCYFPRTVRVSVLNSFLIIEVVEMQVMWTLRLINIFFKQIVIIIIIIILPLLVSYF